MSVIYFFKIAMISAQEAKIFSLNVKTGIFQEVITIGNVTRG